MVLVFLQKYGILKLEVNMADEASMIHRNRVAALLRRMQESTSASGSVSPISVDLETTLFQVADALEQFNRNKGFEDLRGSLELSSTRAEIRFSTLVP
jgi:hypothetical protein